MIESALSIIIAGLFGYWHVLYSRVIGLSGGMDRRNLESSRGMHDYFAGLYELLRDANGRPPGGDGK